MSVRLIAVLVVVVLLAVAQADPGWGRRSGIPVPTGSVVRGLAPMRVAAQDDNENENDNSADEEDDGDNSGDDGDNSGDDDDDDADNDDGDDDDGDDDDDDDDADNDDGDDDDDSGDDNDNSDDSDDNDNEGNENDDGDDNGNGNDNDGDDNDDADNDEDNDDRVVAVPPSGPIVIATIPPPAPRYLPAPRPEPVVVEEPYLTEASAVSEGGVAEVRIGGGKVVVRLFPWTESGITVSVRFVDPATLAPVPGRPVVDLMFVVEAHDAAGAPLASLLSEVNVNVLYDDGDVADLDEAGLLISHLDPAAGSWRPAPKPIRDTVTNFLAASITELGAYAVHAP